MLNIDNVIKELQKTNPNGFINQGHFQIEFGYACKRTYPECELTFDGEYNTLSVQCGEERFCFDFRYFTKEETRILNHGFKVQLRNHCDKELDNQTVLLGDDIYYCLFLTNDENSLEKEMSELITTSCVYKKYNYGNGLFLLT